MGVNISERDALLLQWNAAIETLAIAKKRESALRLQVLDLFENTPDEGITGIALGHGYSISRTDALAYSLPKESEKVRAVIGQLPEGTAARLFSEKFSLNLAEYRKLPIELRRIVDTIVTTKPKSPTVKLVEPKVED